MHPVEVLGDGAGLVRLKMSDEMPAESLFCQFCDPFDAFLHDVFAKITLSGSSRFDDLVEGLFFADREQMDVLGTTPGFHCSFGQQIRNNFV